MNLADLIRGIPQAGPAGTDKARKPAVAPPPAPSPKPSPGAETAWRWLLHLPHGPREVTFAPAVDRAEALRLYPEATYAEALPESAPDP